MLAFVFVFKEFVFDEENDDAVAATAVDDDDDGGCGGPELFSLSLTEMERILCSICLTEVAMGGMCDICELNELVGVQTCCLTDKFF